MASSFNPQRLSDPAALTAFVQRASADEIAAVLSDRMHHEELLAAILQGPRMNAALVGELLRAQCPWESLLRHPVVTGAMLLDGVTRMLDRLQRQPRENGQWARTNGLEAARVVLQMARLGALHDDPPAALSAPEHLIAHARICVAQPVSGRADRPRVRTATQQIEAEHALAVLIWAGAASPAEVADRWEVRSALAAGAISLPWMTRDQQWSLLQQFVVLATGAGGSVLPPVERVAHALAVLTLEAQSDGTGGNLRTPAGADVMRHWTAAIRTYVTAPNALAHMAHHWQAAIRRVPVETLRHIWRRAADPQGPLPENRAVWQEAVGALAVQGVFNDAMVVETLQQGHGAAREAVIAVLDGDRAPREGAMYPVRSTVRLP